MLAGKAKFMLLLILLLLIPGASVFANELPKEIECVNIQDIPGYNPIGTIDKQELTLQNDFGDGFHPQFNSIWPVYSAQITRTRSGYHWRGWKVSGPGPGTLTLSQSFTASNGWSSTIGFSHSVLSATVGYNVTYSRTMTASYSRNVTSGRWGHIGYDDRYDNTYHDLDLTVTLVWLGIPISTEHGTGRTWQWTRFAYYYTETSSASVPPSPH